MQTKKILSYWDQLLALAGDEERLLMAFDRADVPTSTFYRARMGSDLHLNTAMKVAVHLPLTGGSSARRRRKAGSTLEPVE